MKHMLRFTYALAAMLLLSIGSLSAQNFAVLLNENFNAGTQPVGWTRVQQPGSDGWQFGVSSYTSSFWDIPVHPDGSLFTASNDDQCDCDMSDDQLIAPMFNLLPYDSITLIFDYFHDAEWGSTAYLEFSYDGGANWYFITLPPVVGAWNIDLGYTIRNGQAILGNGVPFYFTNQMMFRFAHGDGGAWADGVAVDNVALVAFSNPCDDVQELACDAQTTLSLEGVASIDWQHTGLCDAFLVAGQQQLYTYTPTSTGNHVLAVTNVTSTSTFPFFQYYFKESSLGCDTLGWSCISSFAAPGVSNGFVLQAGVEYYILVASEEFTLPVSQTFAISCPADPTCDADAGTATAVTDPVCLENGSATLSVTLDGNAVVPTGYQITYGLANSAGVIEAINPSGSFNVTAIGDYSIHTLVYDPNTLNLGLFVPGFATVSMVYGQLIQGGGTICAGLDVAGVSFDVITCVTCTADAGTLAANASPVCFDANGTVISASVGNAPVVPAGYSVGYGLTNENGVIIDVALAPSFTVLADGSYTIHTLVYDPLTLNPLALAPGTTGADVDALLIQGGGTICGSLDLVGAPISVVICAPCDADAGTITADGTPICLTNGTADLSATPDGNDFVPTGYQMLYVLTQGSGLVIIDAATTPDFQVTTGGNYTIHTLVFNPSTLDITTVQFGVTTGFDVNELLQQGGGVICGSLDVAGAAFVVEAPFAGTITANAQTCLTNGNAIVVATPSGNAVVPAGYAVTYGLANAGGTLVQIGSSPSFNVSTVGTYTVHTLVYDPATLNTGLFVPGLVTVSVVQGAVGQVCASFDAVGATVEVIACAQCDADAGTLTAVADPVCLENGSADISATVSNAPNVPSGYQTIYVLTEGTGLVIVATNSTPDFTVTSIGSYTIHTLVYDPNTLDLAIVTPGVTTGLDVYALLQQGGGVICGALDVTGAPVTVQTCIVPCLANAGTLTAVASTVCLVGGSATIAATPNGNAVVPAGFSVGYAVTNASGVVTQIGLTPSFTVNAAGVYTIHTLVYDPLTINPLLFQPGVTTAAMVNAMLIQGGGSICGSLDLIGATVTVQNCTSTCDVSAGTLITSSSLVCLFDGFAVLAATHVQQPSYPIGYEVLYVLTEGNGLTIVTAGAFPVFTVTTGGNYTIHTLVYDPNTLNPNSVTTGLQVNALLLQGGGSICGALDVAGAAIEVPDLPSTVGQLANDGDLLYLVNASGTSGYQWYFNGNPIPGATASSYTISESGNYAVVYTGENGCVQSSSTLPFTFSGGNISVDEHSIFRAVSLFPNPNNGQFNIRGELAERAELIISVLDVTGRAIVPAIAIQVGDLFNHPMDMSNVANGLYFVQIGSEHGNMTIRFMKQ